MNNKDIDLRDRCVTFSEIYSRLIRCVYRKFIARKGFAFSQRSFEKLLEKVEKFATRTLKSRVYLLQEREVMQLVGREAFECGLLIGYDDFRLVTHPTNRVPTDQGNQGIQGKF